MGVTKKVITQGNGVDFPKSGDTITMEYTGNLEDPNAENGKGKQCVKKSSAPPMKCEVDWYFRFDSSVGRGDFKTKIGVGQVIKGQHLSGLADRTAVDTK